jgi:hypothetical protein
MVVWLLGRVLIVAHRLFSLPPHALFQRPDLASGPGRKQALEATAGAQRAKRRG